MSEYDVGKAPDLLWEATSSRYREAVRSNSAVQQRWKDAWMNFFESVAPLLRAYTMDVSLLSQPASMRVYPNGRAQPGYKITVDSEKFGLTIHQCSPDTEPDIRIGDATLLVDPTVLRVEPYSKAVVSPNGAPPLELFTTLLLRKMR